MKANVKNGRRTNDMKRLAKEGRAVVGLQVQRSDPAGERIVRTPVLDPGEPVRLTIDSRLQDYAASLVKDESASIVVMEVDTGNVLALVSMPGFDPDVFSKVIAADYWKRSPRCASKTRWLMVLFGCQPARPVTLACRRSPASADS